MASFSIQHTSISLHLQPPIPCKPHLRLPHSCRLRNPILFRPQIRSKTAAADKFTGEVAVPKESFDNVNDDNQCDVKGEPKGLDERQMVRVCDRLIEIFLVDKPNTSDWRKLLAFSKEWSTIRPYFYQRCQDRAINVEDLVMKEKFLRLGRKLKEIDEDVQRHDELLEVIKGAPSEISGVVARRRKDFTLEFFDHLHVVTESYHDNATEQRELLLIGNKCLAAVQGYDASSESIEALDAAELKFRDIINSPSLDIACRKIDGLAEKQQLDSALMLMITKAWSAAKESNMTKDEVKDILYHFYMKARDNLQHMVPKEIRILKYLLTIEDPEEQLSAMNDAFTPGVEAEVASGDSLHTTPGDLFAWIRTVLDSYRFSQEGSLIREARDLMNPKVIQRLEKLQKVIQDKFL